MKSLKFVLIFLISFPAAAQYTFNGPLTGKAYKVQKYSGVRGTPYLLDDWTTGIAFTSGKIAYKDIKLKLDIVDHVLFYNVGEETYEFLVSIPKFTLTLNPADSSTFLAFKKGYSGDGIQPNQYAQVLVEGQITFLKKDSKRIQESTQLNTGAVESFLLVTKYFALKKGGKIVPMRLAKSEVSSMIDSNTQVLDYIKEKELSFKKESDIIAIFKYYNSLPH